MITGFRHSCEGCVSQSECHQTGKCDFLGCALSPTGVVLRRPLGSSGPFKEHAELPTDIADVSSKKAGRKSARREPQKHPKRTEDDAADRKAALAFEKEQKRRERERAKEEAARQKERERWQQAVDKAQNTLAAARRTHEKKASDSPPRRSKPSDCMN
jgi:hypothetical protein